MSPPPLRRPSSKTSGNRAANRILNCYGPAIFLHYTSCTFFFLFSANECLRLRRIRPASSLHSGGFTTDPNGKFPMRAASSQPGAARPSSFFVSTDDKFISRSDYTVFASLSRGLSCLERGGSH